MKVWNIEGPLRRLGAVCVAVVLAAGVIACGDDEDEPPAETAAANSGEECTPKHDFETVEPGVLKAVFTAYPPYGFTENGEAKGIDGELLAEIAAMECLELEASDADPAGIPAMVSTGRVDVAGGDWWRSKDRQKVVEMTDPTYLDSLVVISKEGIDTVDGLMGKSIGDIQGNIWNAEAKDLYGDDYKLYRTPDQVIQDLKSGRTEVAFFTAGAGAYQLEQNNLTGYQVKVMPPDDRLTVTKRAPQSGIMHALNNDELTTALNENLAELKANGTLQEIVERNGLPAEVIDTGEPYFL